VCELALPPGCMLVRVRERGREWLSTADTALEAHMRLTALIALEAHQSLPLLRKGCGFRYRTAHC
jgi:hypothetical protein